MTSIFFSPAALSSTVNSVFSSAAAARCGCGACGGHGYGSGGGNAPLLFELLGEFGGFDNGQRGELIHNLVKIGGHGFGNPFKIIDISFRSVTEGQGA